jgi:uncharacterized protein YcbK (DUF882 family)
VRISFARKFRLNSLSRRAGCCTCLAVLLVIFGSQSLQNATAEGDTRTLSFHHTHTGEDLTVTFKVNGRYDEEALKKINHELRDWRENQTITMDPHLMDLLWEVYRELEATEPIWVVCGYRSPATNAMLRKRSSGVAKFSQHMLGKAMDFYIPGVPLEKLREVGLRAQRGGVGFYPSSNFVHLDTGNVRHWPHMPDAQLAQVLKKGPLTRYAKNGNASRDTKVASAAPVANPFAKLFGGADEAEDDALAAAAPSAPAPAKPAAIAASEKPRPAAPEKKVASAVPLPPARPAAKSRAAVESASSGFNLASASSRPTEFTRPQSANAMGQVSLSANDVISARGFWQGLPQADSGSLSTASKASDGIEPPRPPAEIAGVVPTAIEGLDPKAIGTVAPWPVPAREGAGNALAYAPANAAVSPGRAAPMGTGTAKLQADTTVATKRTGNRPTLVSAPPRPGERFSDPWLRAMILSPSAGGFLSTSLLGAPNYLALKPYLRKPATSVMMTFSADPYLGMSTQKFSGAAVVFVSTVTFYQHTAALR